MKKMPGDSPSLVLPVLLVQNPLVIYRVYREIKTTYNETQIPTQRSFLYYPHRASCGPTEGRLGVGEKSEVKCWRICKQPQGLESSRAADNTYMHIYLYNRNITLVPVEQAGINPGEGGITQRRGPLLNVPYILRHRNIVSLY